MYTMNRIKLPTLSWSRSTTMFAAGTSRDPIELQKRLALGYYYSRYSITSVCRRPEGAYAPHQTDTSLPANHVYDKVITARVDLKRFWNLKVEGHFMNGYGFSTIRTDFIQK